MSSSAALLLLSDIAPVAASEPLVTFLSRVHHSSHRPVLRHSVMQGDKCPPFAPRWLSCPPDQHYYGGLRLLPRPCRPHAVWPHLCRRLEHPEVPRRRRSHHLTQPPFPARRPRRLRRRDDRDSTVWVLCPCGTALPDPDSLRRMWSGSARRYLRFRSSSDGVHFHCGWPVRIPVVLSGGSSRRPSVTGSFDREPSNSVEQTFTVVVVGFMVAPT